MYKYIRFRQNMVQNLGFRGHRGCLRATGCLDVAATESDGLKNKTTQFPPRSILARAFVRQNRGLIYATITKLTK